MTVTLSYNKIQIFQNVKLHDVLHVTNKYKETQKSSESEYKLYCEAAKPRVPFSRTFIHNYEHKHTHLLIVLQWPLTD